MYKGCVSLAPPYLPTIFVCTNVKIYTCTVSRLVHHHSNEYKCVNCYFIFPLAGQEDYDRLRPLSYIGTDVFLVCYDIANRTSLENVQSKWFPEITHHCPGVPFILLALKADLKQEGRDYVTYEEGNQMAKEIGTDCNNAFLAAHIIILVYMFLGAAGFFEASSFSNQGLSTVMDGVVSVGLSAVRTQNSKKRFNLFRRKRYFLSLKIFFSLLFVLSVCRKNKSLLTASEVDSSILPPPPSLPIGKKAPWININSSVLSQEWNKLVNQEQFSDVHFSLGRKTFFAHKIHSDYIIRYHEEIV